MAEKLNKDAVYRAAKPKEKDYTINDVGGLALLVKTSGVKTWRFIYRYQGKQNRLGLGAYPASSLERARQEAVKMRQLLANGQDPSQERKQAKQAAQVEGDNERRKAQGLPLIGSFKEAAQDWLKSTERTTREVTHQKKAKRFELHVYPSIGDKLLNEIKSSDINGTAFS